MEKSMSGRQQRSARVLGLAIVAACILVAPATWAANGPKVSPNVQINAPQKAFPLDNPSRSTATLAASEDGTQLLAGWDDFQGFCGAPTNLACPPQSPPGLSGYGFSTNGGASWTDGGAPPLINGAWTAGHPWADRGTDRGLDNYYFTSRMRTSAVGTASAGIGISRGHFTHGHGGTFVWDNTQIINSSTPGDFYSRQSVAAAKDDSGSAYIVLSNILELCGVPAFGFGQIEAWRTHDGGLTWDGPVVVSADDSGPTLDPNDPACASTGTQQVIPVVAIGPAGQVYVVWQFGPAFDANGVAATTSKLAFSHSLDGGATFSAPQFIVELNNNRANPPVGYGKNRMNDQPRMAVATSGRFRGRIYVTFYSPVQAVAGPATAQSNVSTQSYITYSDNQGQTWSTPAAIAAAVPATGLKRFWPTPTVRSNGDLDVVYLESQETQVTPDPTDIECNVGIGNNLFRKGPLSSLVNTYWTESRDGGVSFSAPVRVSTVTSNWCAAQYTFAGALYSNFGDYLGVASADNRTFVAWPDDRSGFSDILFATVKGTARP
jgi:hypothetical protein